ncbi:MAG: hypothetical protein VX642_16070 [Bdellovibrionota bacterium]|nr:hypothetical protein [Bdellovibrionota bacterium]
MIRVFYWALFLLFYFFGQAAFAIEGPCKTSSKENVYYTENPVGFDHLTKYLARMHEEANDQKKDNLLQRKIKEFRRRYFPTKDEKILVEPKRAQALILSYMELLSYSKNEIEMMQMVFSKEIQMVYGPPEASREATLFGFEKLDNEFTLNLKDIKILERYLISTAQNRFRSIAASDFDRLQEITENIYASVQRFYRQNAIMSLNENVSPLALKRVSGFDFDPVTEGSLKSIDRFVAPKQREWVENNKLPLFQGGFFIRNLGSRSPHESNRFNGQSKGIFSYQTKDGERLISYRPIDNVTIREILKFYEDIEKSSAKDFLLKPVGIHFVYGRARLLFPIKKVYFGNQSISRFSDLEKKVQKQLEELFVREFFDSTSHPDSRSFAGTLFENEYLFFKEDGFLGMALPVRAEMLMDAFYQGKLYKSSEIEFRPED